MSSNSSKNHNVAVVSLSEERESHLDKVHLAEEYDFELFADEILSCNGS